MSRAFRRAAACLLVASAALAQGKAPAIGGARGDFLQNFSQIEKKFTMMAEALPPEKYGWRPGTGVRSFCEVFAHISAENYEMGKAFGAVAAPANLADGENAKCLGDKATTVAALKTSFAAITDAVKKTSDADIEKPFTLFGFAQPRRAWLLSTAEHAGEHLGQLIAYARVNNIVPPWSK